LVVVPGWHVPAASQQPAHVEAEHGGGAPWHTPETQPLPSEAQLAQAAPPPPHASLVSPVRQFPAASQHPVAHVEASQGGLTPAQTPDWHAKPS